MGSNQTDVRLRAAIRMPTETAGARRSRIYVFNANGRPITLDPITKSVTTMLTIVSGPKCIVMPLVSIGHWLMPTNWSQPVDLSLQPLLDVTAKDLIGGSSPTVVPEVSDVYLYGCPAHRSSRAIPRSGRTVQFINREASTASFKATNLPRGRDEAYSTIQPEPPNNLDCSSWLEEAGVCNLPDELSHKSHRHGESTHRAYSRARIPIVVDLLFCPSACRLNGDSLPT
jgi:hypothetical protein